MHSKSYWKSTFPFMQNVELRFIVLRVMRLRIPKPGSFLNCVDSSETRTVLKPESATAKY